MRKLNYLFLIIVLLFISCQSSNEDSDIINYAPDNFTITISEIQSTKAKLSWTEAKDPDGDKVTYTIELNDKVIIENLAKLNYMLENLSDKTTYNVKIIAKDSKGKETTSTKSFLTNNLPIPSDFSVTVNNIGYTKATLHWTESSTTENNKISYTIILNNEIIKEGVNKLDYEVTSLTHNTLYKGKIKAIADNKQTVIKEFEFKTLENKAPQTFKLTASPYGFGTINYTFEKAKDPENDEIEYRLILNNDDVTEQFANTPITPKSNLWIKNLSGGTSYTLKVKAIDAYKNISYSNVVNVKTNKTPPDNFNVDVFYVQNQIRLRWDKLTESKYSVGSVNGKPNKSYYILDGVKHDLSKALTYDYDTERTAQFNQELISPNEEHTLQIVLAWAFSEKKSYSNILTVFNKIYTDTSTKVKKAYISDSTVEYGPLQFTIIFENHLISEFEHYEITKIKFHDKAMLNYITPELGARNKIYITGNITQKEFNHLSQFNDGYIEVKDQKGYHKLNFKYGIEN